MKYTILGLLAAALTSCVYTTTTNTLPDGTKVVVTAKSADPVAIANAVSAAEKLAPIIQKMIEKQTPATPVALPTK